MGIIMSMTVLDWIILIALFALCAGACWLNHDSRKRGLPVGGASCGGCPYCCQPQSDCHENSSDETSTELLKQSEIKALKSENDKSV